MTPEHLEHPPARVPASADQLASVRTELVEAGNVAP
jgi:hypothetical protein